MGKAVDRIISEVYYDLKSPASYAGILKILEEARKKNPKITLNDIDKFLTRERTYTLHKPTRKRFLRLKTIPTGFHTDWQCDLCIFDQIKQDNDGYRYLLVCIDVLSRMLFVAPTKSKRSEDMIEAFEKIFAKANILPNKIYSDRGVEFQAKKMLDYFEKKDIIKHAMYSPDIHAGVVERANRTIKGRLYKYFSQNNTLRWIDVIDKIIQNINNSVNRTTGVKPNSVTFDNARDLWEKLYKAENIMLNKTPKLKRGDIVRITKEKGTFDKGYYPNFTDELFKISKVNPTQPVSYRIEDLEGEEIKGIFYQPELVKTTKNTTHRIAEILKSRTRKGVKEHFVKWIGYSDKYNSWIKDSDLVA